MILCSECGKVSQATRVYKIKNPDVYMLLVYEASDVTNDEFGTLVAVKYTRKIGERPHQVYEVEMECE